MKLKKKKKLCALRTYHNVVLYNNIITRINVIAAHETFPQIIIAITGHIRLYIYTALH